MRRRRKKEGAIWISTVLSLTLGIVAISLILASAIPLVGKIKDRNTVIQTKEMLSQFEQTIQDVANEGPGSQRELSPVMISAGKLVVDSLNDELSWTMETDAEIQEPNVIIEEGVLQLQLTETNIEGRYVMEVKAPFTTVDLALNSTYQNPFVGKYRALIKHTGKFTSNKPIVHVVMQ